MARRTSPVSMMVTTLILAAVVVPGWAQEPDPVAPKASPKASQKKRPARPDPSGTYMGRPIADVMSFHGADWLFRDSREQEEQPERMLDALKIPPGATVADIGAGAGYTSLRLARRVGSKGTVLATDVQPQMLRMLADNARSAGVRNIRPILCTATDPKLPPASVDLAIMVDVYHECSDPEATLAGLRAGLKPTGRLVLVEFRGEDETVPIKPEHKMTTEQVRRELEANGFRFKEAIEFLPWQHILVFEKAPDPAPAGAAETKPAG